MRLSWLAASFLVLAGTTAASAQLVYPQRALDDSRRAGLETNRRLARDAAAQRKTEETKAEKARRADKPPLLRKKKQQHTRS